MNIKTIAQLAGVSVATVSKIMNNYSDIGEETRLRVLKIMEENGYKPSSSARTLATKTSHLIGVVFAGELNSDLDHPFFIAVLNSFKRQMGFFGYDLILFSNQRFFHEKEDYLARCRHYHIDGCIIIAGDRIEPSVRQLAQSDIPCVGIDLQLEGERSAHIMSDNVKVASKVVEHFYLNGYRDIGFLGINRESEVISIRERSFMEAIRNFGLTLQDDACFYSEGYEEEYGYAAMMSRIDSGTPLPRAIFAVSDMLAIGAMRALKDRGLSIPADVAVVGCDDIETSRHTDPSLTTVRQDSEKIGRLAAMMLFDLLNKQSEARTILVDPELIVRQSCGGLR